MAEQPGILRIEAEREVPIWFINHFLDTTSSNYLKLVTLREICRAFAEGASDDDMMIAAHSFELLPPLERTGEDFGSVVMLESKGHSAALFWRHFRNLRRPIVLRREGRELTPLFDPHSDEALEIKHLSVNSPVELSLSGVVGALVDLSTGKLFAQRDNERVSIAAENLRRIVETSHLIEDPATPEGVRHFARDQLEALMNRQYRVNTKLGIRRAEVSAPEQHGHVLRIERAR